MPDVRQVMIHVDQDPTGEERANPGKGPSSAPEWYGQDGGGEGMVWRKHHRQSYTSSQLALEGVRSDPSLVSTLC